MAAALRTLHLPAGPFTDALPARGLLLAEDGPRLSRRQLGVLAAAAGPDAVLVVYWWNWAEEPEPSEVVPMDLRSGYPRLADGWSVSEHALVGADGTWALLTDTDEKAAVAGSPELLAGLRAGLDPDEVDRPVAAEMLAEVPWWAPELLAHLYGEDWPRSLELPMPPAHLRRRPRRRR